MSILSLNSQSVLLSILLLMITGVLLILIMRFLRKGDFAGFNFSFAKVDPLRKTGVAMKLGISFSLTFVILAFSWTEYEVREISSSPDFFDEMVEIDDTPRTMEKPAPPPPPPAKSIEISDSPELVKNKPEEPVEVDPIIEYPRVTYNNNVALPPIPLPPPLPPKVDEPDTPFRLAEEMPRFPGCEHLRTKEEKYKCHQEKLLSFVYDKVVYPSIAKENNIQGQVVVRFVVDEKGFVSQAEILKDLAGGCGKEVLRVVRLMNDMPERWIAGKQRGRPVKVWFNLPVKFRLE